MEGDRRDAPQGERQRGARETLAVKHVMRLVGARAEDSRRADTRLSGAHFLLIQTKWLPGIIFSSNSFFSYLQG